MRRNDGAHGAVSTCLSSRRLRTALGVVASLSIAAFSSGCGKRMTSADCERVGKHMRSIWNAEADGAVPTDSQGSERAKNVIRSEGDKMEADWLSQCRRELEGREVEQPEVDCILASKSVEDLHKCASPHKSP